MLYLSELEVVELLQIDGGDTELELLREFPIVNQSVVIRSSFCPTINRWPGSYSIVTGSEDNIVYIYNLDKKGEPWCNMLQGHEVNLRLGYI